MFFLLTRTCSVCRQRGPGNFQHRLGPGTDINTIEAGIPRELARVIQQSMEKDPLKRPENLIALRSALLPFSARGTSQADLGRRMAAFFIDTIMAAVVVVAISQFVGVFAILVGGMLTGNNLKIQA